MSETKHRFLEEGGQAVRVERIGRDLTADRREQGWIPPCGSPRAGVKGGELANSQEYLRVAERYVEGTQDLPEANL